MLHPLLFCNLEKTSLTTNNYNNKILASVDAEIYNHRKNRTKEIKNINTVDLGYKNESYLSEEEMIQGYIVPTFNELSESEKEIYKTK